MERRKFIKFYLRSNNFKGFLQYNFEHWYANQQNWLKLNSFWKFKNWALRKIRLRYFDKLDSLKLVTSPGDKWPIKFMLKSTVKCQTLVEKLSC